MATPIYDVESYVTILGTDTTKTVSHTCSTLPNRYLLVWLATRENTSNPSVTYAGVAMTLLDSEVQLDVVNKHLYLFGLANPATGANNIVASWTTASAGFIRAASFTNASPDAPVTYKSKGTTADATLNANSTTTDMVVDGVYSYRSTNTTAVTAVAVGSQTEIYKAGGVTGSHYHIAGTSYLAGGDPTTTMGWTLTNNTSFMQIAAVLKVFIPKRKTMLNII